jgi:hypothetical protein
MGDLFAKISGQFTGPLLISAFFPVLLFLVGLTLVVLPVTPYGHEFSNAVLSPKQWESHPVVALVLTMVVLLLSLILYNMNVAIVRLYEGYPLEKSWIARPLLRSKKRSYRRAMLLRERIAKLRREIRVTKLQGVDLHGVDDVQGDLARLLNSAYPDGEDLVLPTRLGNVIRAFETYTTRQYGSPILNLWPRLQGVIDGPFAQAIDGVKTSFDFMIHSSFLCGVLALLTASAGLFWKTRTSSTVLQPWLAWALVFACMSYLFYLASIPRAAEWGTQIKSAFDLYRLPLLAKLGYETKPTDLADERNIWANLNYHFAFPDMRTFPDLPYRTPASSVRTIPTSTVVKSERTVELVVDGWLKICLRVENVDPTAYDADHVIIREEVPSGYVYVPDSVDVQDNGGTKVTYTLLSIDPVQIDLGPINHEESKKVEFAIRKAPP